MTLRKETASIKGRLRLRKYIDQCYRHLEIFNEEGFMVLHTFFDPHDGFRVHVGGVWPRSCREIPPFTVTLPLLEIADLDDVGFLPYLTRKLVQCMPEHIRLLCSEVLDEWAVQVGKLPQNETLLNDEETEHANG